MSSLSLRRSSSAGSSATTVSTGGPSRQRIQALAQSLSSLKVAESQPKRLIELDDRLMRFEAAEQSKIKLLREELERTRVCALRTLRVVRTRRARVLRAALDSPQSS